MYLLRVFVQALHVGVGGGTAILTCIEYFIFRLPDPSPTILSLKVSVWELPLRVFVQALHVGVGGGTVQIVVQLLYILSMVTLHWRKTLYKS